MSPIKLRGTKVELLFPIGLEVRSHDFVPEENFLSGLPSSLITLDGPDLHEEFDENGQFTEIILPTEFPSGGVMLFKTWVYKQHEELDEFIASDVDEAFSDLNLIDLNIVLYRCGAEESDITPGHGAYNIPGYGEILYCGLEGFMSVLRPIMQENDLSHSLCANLREGYWALDYLVERLIRSKIHVFV